MYYHFPKLENEKLVVVSYIDNKVYCMYFKNFYADDFLSFAFVFEERNVKLAELFDNSSPIYEFKSSSQVKASILPPFLKKMPVSLKIIMGRSYDSNPSVALIINHNTFLFNAPPQIFRALIENHIRPKSVDYIFLTSTSISASSGFMPYVGYYSMSSPVKCQLIGPSNFLSYFYHLPDIDLESSFDSIESSLTLPNITVSPIKMLNSISYIVKVADSLYKINHEALCRLKIEPGSWIKNLKSNESIEINGVTIKKEDIFLPDNKYSFLFVDIHDLRDLSKLPPSDELKLFDCIIHFTHSDLLLNEQYINSFTADGFPTNYCFMNDPAILFHNSKLLYDHYSQVNQSLFPPLPGGYAEDFPNLPPNFISLKSKDVIKDNFNMVHHDTLKSNSLTFLGTSACTPSPQRCNSGYLLQTHDGFIVLDCGNGFLEQIQRKFGPQTSEFIIKNIKCIWISHHHFDHYFGLVDLLFKHAQVLKKYDINDQTISLYCDSFITQIIEEKVKLYEKDENLSFHYKAFERNAESPVDICGVKIESIPTTHCESSMSCVITFSNEKRLAYTGDMLNDKKFENGVKHCDYLISETTYSEPTYKTAQYNHMDYDSVMQLKKNLGAEYLFMTHFGSAYQFREVLPDPTSIYVFDYLYLTDDTIHDIFDIVHSVII